MKKFEFFDHTGDEGLIVYGRSIEDLFKNAAEGFFEVLTIPKKVKARSPRSIAFYANGYEELLIAWLNEFLYLFDTDSLLFSRYDIRELDDHHLSADVWGERYDEKKHPIRRIIKAVTYHQLSVEEHNGRWEARVVFDL